MGESHGHKLQINKAQIRGRSLFISWGGAILVGVMKKIIPRMEGGGSKFHWWINGGRGESQIWFPFPFLASKSSGFWGALLPRHPHLSLFFFIFHTPLFTTTIENENMKRYAYAEMPSVRFFCGSAHRHLIIRKCRHFIRCILFPTSVIRKVNLQHPYPTRNIVVTCHEIESYRYIMLKKLSYHIRLYCTLCLFL